MLLNAVRIIIRENIETEMNRSANGIYWVGGPFFVYNRIIRKIIKKRIDYNAALYSMIVNVRRYFL
jgi:hypothetical protein